MLNNPMPFRKPSRAKPRAAQRGVAAMMLVLLVLLGFIALFTFRMDRKQPELDAERKTAMALAQAKEALLGYAAKDLNRPGTLPCPDADNDGRSNTAGVDLHCEARLGRLPWYLLRLPDIRDGSAERLWYALSPNFFSTVNTNSTKLGQITMRNPSGGIVNDASMLSGVVAVIIAPGPVLKRQGAAGTQDRSCVVGTDCDIDLKCTVPATTPICQAVNYLDVVVGVEDNQSFSPGTSDGFIAGVAKDGSGNLIVNDRMITITTKELFNVVTQRMARELAAVNLATSSTWGSSVTTIAGLSKPTMWNPNNWDAAVEGDGTTSYVTSTAITLKFVNCAIIYTITSSGAISRNPRTC